MSTTEWVAKISKSLLQNSKPLVLLEAAQQAQAEGGITLPDPEAALLFESTVEAAFLVANCDGEFDQTEREAFTKIVVHACGGSVTEGQMSALLSDLQGQLTEDGMERRFRMVARGITEKQHQQDVLLVSCLIAHISGGISAHEKQALTLLAQAFGLGDAEVSSATTKARMALSTA